MGMPGLHTGCYRCYAIRRSHAGHSYLFIITVVIFPLTESDWVIQSTLGAVYPY